MPRPKLLLADDSIAIRKVVELTFADEGIEVFSVPDATSAMQKFVEVQPDIVLVDVGLEGTNGYQICEMIKQDESTRHIPVLLLVGSFEPFDQDAAERSGADGFLTKPFQSIRELVGRVSELLGNRETEIATDGITPEPTQEPVQEVSNVVPMPGLDTSDIDSLYKSSFSRTMEIEDFDTVEDIFDDEGLDDELIETIHVEGPADDTAPTVAFATSDVNGLSTDAMESEAVIEEPTAHDKEQLSAIEPGFQDVEGAEQPHGGDSPVLESRPDPYDEAAEVKEFDWSPAAKIEDEGPVETDPEAFSWNGQPSEEPTAQTEEEPIVLSLNRGFAEAEELPAAAPDDAEDHVFPIVSETSKEPSPELIAVIAQRVIERLSDKVVREVAQEAVPRIAEKLIREALDEDAKQ